MRAIWLHGMPGWELSISVGRAFTSQLNQLPSLTLCSLTRTTRPARPGYTRTWLVWDIDARFRSSPGVFASAVAGIVNGTKSS